MTKNTIEMNKAIDNFCIRMADSPERETIETCTVDEYYDYLQSFCDFCEED